MNFNDLQEAWKKSGEGENEFSLTIPALKKANQPIDRIRKNMKNELFLQVLVIAMLAFAPFYFDIKGKLLVAYYTLYGLLVAISGYYFFRFYRFFQFMHDYDATTKDSLYELYYEIRIHCEMYKSLTFLLVPFAFLIGGIIDYSLKMNQLPVETLLSNDRYWISIPVVAVIITLVIISFTNWWVNHFYGKHANRIRKILDELME